MKTTTVIRNLRRQANSAAKEGRRLRMHKWLHEGAPYLEYERAAGIFHDLARALEAFVPSKTPVRPTNVHPALDRSLDFGHLALRATDAPTQRLR